MTNKDMIRVWEKYLATLDALLEDTRESFARSMVAWIAGSAEAHLENNKPETATAFAKALKHAIDTWVEKDETPTNNERTGPDDSDERTDDVRGSSYDRF